MVIKMRELRFRVWFGKKMWESFSVYDEFVMEKEQEEPESGQFDYGSLLLQYIGLEDKNGKGIYEGDIIKLKIYPKEGPADLAIPVIVEFYEGAFFFRDPDNVVGSTWAKPICTCMDSVSECGSGDYYEMEIIGNIYEHPELLTK